MTPEEEQALLDSVMAERAERRQRQPGAPAPTSIRLAPVPVREQPDVDEAAMRARTAARERFELADPAGAGVQAELAVDKVLGAPPSVPAKPSLGESVARAYLPKVVVRDARPDSDAEKTVEWAADLVDKYAATKSPLGAVLSTAVAPSAYGLAEAALDRDLQAPLGAEGARVENAALWLMRTLFSTAGAFVMETLENTPTPDIKAGAQAAGQAETWSEALTRFAESAWDVSSLGEQVLDIAPGEMNRVKRETGLETWVQGMAERIENGSGLEEDAQLSVTKKLGPEAGQVAWWLGLGADALIDWEGAVASVPRMLARGATTARRLSSLANVPGVDTKDLSPLLAAIQGHEVDFAREVGERISDGLERDPELLQRLPAEWRTRINEVAMGELGASADEILRLRQLEDPSVPVLPDFPAASAADFFREVSRYPDAQVLPGEGFRRIAQGGQAVDDPTAPVYVLRDASGQTASELGSLQEVAAAAGARGARGDQVWQGDRPVAVWRETEGGPELVPHPWFAGPQEAMSSRTLRQVPRPPQLADVVPDYVPPGGREALEIERYEPPESLPEFAVRTASDFYRQASRHPNAVVAPGEGFRRMSRDVPGEVKDAPIEAGADAVYEIRDADGELVTERMSLVRAKQTMASRARRGDQVWQGNRPVAVWRETDGPSLVPHPWFAGPRETSLLALPARPRAELSDPPRDKLTVTLGGELLRAMTGAPPVQKAPTHYPVDEEVMQDLVNQGLKYDLADLRTLELPRDFDRKEVRALEAALKGGKPLPPVVVARNARGQLVPTQGESLAHVAARAGYSHVPVVERVGRTAIPIEARISGLHATRGDLEVKIGTIDRRLKEGGGRKKGEKAQLLTPKEKKELPAAKAALEDNLRQVLAQIEELEGVRRSQRKAPPPEPETPTRVGGPAPDAYGSELERAFGPAPEGRVVTETLPAVLPPPRGAAPPAFGAELERAFSPPAPAALPTRTPVPPIRGVVRRAARLIGADSLFTSRLRMLSNGALVPKDEAKKIEAEARAALGVTVDQARELIRSRKPMPEDVRAKLSRFVPGLGERLTTKDWMEAKNLALEMASRSSALVRYRVQGIRPLREQLVSAFKDPHVRRRASRAAQAWQDSVVVDRVARWFTADVLDRMPGPVRTSWKKAQSLIERQADELAQEIRKDGAKGAIDRALAKYQPVHPAELERADELLAYDGVLDPAGPTMRDWKHQPDRIAKLLERGAGGAELTTEVRRWAKDSVNAAASAGRDWLRSAAASAGRWKEARLLIEQLPPERARAVYEEVARGNWTGPATSREVTELGLPRYDPREASVYYALHLRERAILADAADEMLGVGSVIRPDDPRMPVLQGVITGNYRDRVGDRWVYRYTEAETTWALNLLRDWGIEPGAGAALGVGRVGEQAVVAPRFLLDELDSLTRAGTLNPEKWTLWGAYQALNRVFKESVTYGVLAPNPAYMLGQALGLLPTLVVTRGVSGAAGTVSTAMFRHPLLTAELLKRVGGADLPLTRARTWEQEMLQVGDDLYTIDELEKAIRDWGLHESRAGFEVGEQLKALVAESERGWFDPRNIDKPTRWWQETIRRWAGSIDMSARIASFLDEVSKGRTLDEAAQLAKASTLDFRAMTPLEQRWMRGLFTFYAFMRKNADSYVLALLQNPGRVGFLGRTAHASFTETLGLTGVEQGSVSEQDVGRLTFKVSRDVVDSRGRPNPDYALKRITTNPIGPSEWLGFMTSILPWKGPGGVLGEDWSNALGYLVPALQSLSIPIQGRLPGRTFQTAQSNPVPPVFMEMAGGSWLADLFEVGPEPLGPEDDPALAAQDASDLLGVPARWAAGNAAMMRGDLDEMEAARQRWQLFRVWFAAPLSRMELGAQAAGVLPTAPYMTQGDAIRDLLAGTRTRPVLDETEVLRRRDEERVQELNRFGRDIGLPRGVGPR